MSAERATGEHGPGPGDDQDPDTTRDRSEPAPDADACGAAGCQRTHDLRLTRREDSTERVLCWPHRKEFWGVTT